MSQLGPRWAARNSSRNPGPMVSITTKGLFKSAALAVAASSVLAAGSASAAACTIGTLAVCNATTGIFDISGVTASFATPANGSLIFDSDGGNLFVNLNRVNSVLANQLPQSGSISFTATINNGNFFTGYNETGAIALAGSQGSFGIAGSGIASDSALFQDDVLLSGLSAPITSGTYTLDWNFTAGTYTGYQATFTTDIPVPLPFIGAGLALGFTRNLRKRAKSVA